MDKDSMISPMLGLKPMGPSCTRKYQLWSPHLDDSETQLLISGFCEPDNIPDGDLTRSRAQFALDDITAIKNCSQVICVCVTRVEHDVCQ